MSVRRLTGNGSDVLMFERRDQNVGQGSTALQAGGHVVIVNNVGITVAEARQIAVDVMNANLLEYRGIAADIAKARGSEITDRFVEQLERENPAGIQQAQSPDFQDALFTVQKEYAKAGDQDLGALLVDLLVDRTKQKGRDILQLVLNESLHTAPKLTNAQINTLSVIFLLRYVTNNGVAEIKALAEFFRVHLQPIIDKFSSARPTLQHLEFTGCGTASMGGMTLEQLWEDQYSAFFKVGFNQEHLDQATLPREKLNGLLMRCLNDPSKIQVAALNSGVLTQKMAANGLSDPEEQSRLRVLFSQGTLDRTEIKERMLAAAPFLKPIADVWDSSGLSNFQLTSVGMAIGHGNIKRFTGEFAPLGIWIHDTI